MISLGFKEFAALPEGTVYTHLVPYAFGGKKIVGAPPVPSGLFVKGVTWYADDKPYEYTYLDLLPQIPSDDEDLPDGNVLRFEGEWERPGTYDYDKRTYGVYEEDEVRLLRDILGRG